MASSNGQSGGFVERFRDLPGFDVEGALQRLDGDWEMFVEFVGEYRTEFAGFFEEFRATLEAGDMESARRSAHSLKGAAGNIGAVNLQAAAKELEDACKERDVPRIQRRLKPVREAFDTMNRSAERLAAEAGAGTAPPPPAEPAGSPASPEELLSALRRLDTALAAFDPVAAEACLDELTARSLPAVLQEPLALLRSQVRDYAFDDAQSTADRMIRKVENA